MIASHSPFRGKISPDWATRLSRFPREKCIRVIVILTTAGRAVGNPLTVIDQIISRHGGRRLAKAADRFGALPVESTPEGILALSRRVEVQAVVED